MFQETRLKLTTLFLLIIMLISGFFSFFIYGLITQELARNVVRAEMRLRASELGVKLPDPLPERLEKLRPEFKDLQPRRYLLADLNEAKNRVKFYLFLLNGFILLISAAAGYFLAGKALEPIEEAMEEQKRFVADASHELRTPLAALKTTTEVSLRDKNLTVKKLKKALEDNLDEVESLGKLTNRLLALVKQPNNGNGPALSSFPVKEVLTKVLKKIKPLAWKKKISLKTELEPGDQMIEADKTAFEELLLILLDNAVKYTPPKGWVALSAGTAGKNLLISVQDNGIGIGPEHLPHIFDRFYRVDTARPRTKTDGFGLGLALAKRIVEQHQGTIKVSSQVGKGTTCSLQLPLKQS